MTTLRGAEGVQERRAGGRACLAAILVTLWTTEVGTVRGPLLTGGQGTEVCRIALQMAEATFRGRGSLAVPSSDLGTLPYRLVVGRKEDPEWRAPALTIDDGVFEVSPTEPADDRAYMERTDVNIHRLVIHEGYNGWRGPSFQLFTVKRGVSLDAFLLGFRHGFLADPTGEYQALGSETDDPPTVFQSLHSTTLWAIATSYHSTVVPTWDVFLTTTDAIQHPCSVEFRMLSAPPELRRLMALLDSTLGDGRNEGTKQSTSRLRVHAKDAWTMVVNRPWSLGQRQPYDARTTVDEGLLAWSRLGPRYRQVHDAILHQYPLALRALSRHYSQQFGLSRIDADAAAGYGMDIGFRSNFFFLTSDQPAPRTPSPWKPN